MISSHLNHPHPCVPVTHLNLFRFSSTLPSPCPSATADLWALTVGPLLVAPSWHTVNRLGRGRSQCQLYWCRNGHTRRTGPESAAAACVHLLLPPPQTPPSCYIPNAHIYQHTCRCNPNACTPASTDQCQIGLVRLGPS